MSFSDSFPEHDEIDRQEWAENRDIAYEATVVKYLLKHLDISARDFADNESASSLTTFSLARFHELYSRYPCRLSARRLPNVHRLTLPTINQVKWRDGRCVDPFFKSPIFLEFEKVLEEYHNEAVLIGMVFPCPEVVHLVLHGGSAQLDQPGSRLCKTTEEGRLYVMEPFVQFVKNFLTAPARRL